MQNLHPHLFTHRPTECINGKTVPKKHTSFFLDVVCSEPYTAAYSHDLPRRERMPHWSLMSLTGDADTDSAYRLLQYSELWPTTQVNPWSDGIMQPAEAEESSLGRALFLGVDPVYACSPQLIE
jgi:hypothetical protein